MKNRFKGKIALFVLLAIAMFFAVSAIVMVLWNHLLPEILGVKAITFWQASGILILSKILFGGFHRKKGFGREKFQKLKEGGLSIHNDHVAKPSLEITSRRTRAVIPQSNG